MRYGLIIASHLIISNSVQIFWEILDTSCQLYFILCFGIFFIVDVSNIDLAFSCVMLLGIYQKPFTSQLLLTCYAIIMYNSFFLFQLYVGFGGNVCSLLGRSIFGWRTTSCFLYNSLLKNKPFCLSNFIIFFEITVFIHVK